MTALGKTLVLRPRRLPVWAALHLVTTCRWAIECVRCEPREGALDAGARSPGRCLRARLCCSCFRSSPVTPSRPWVRLSGESVSPSSELLKPGVFLENLK